MTYFELILLSIGLAMDASAVSLGAAASGFASHPRAIFRLAFHFGLFQAVMPGIGWLLGSTVVEYIVNWDHWIAFGLLAIVGGRMIHEGLHPDAERISSDPSKGLTLISLSIATSIDALAVGLSFSMLEMDIFIPCLIIGVTTFVLAILAIRLGRVAGEYLGSRVEVLGGLILLGIGVRILYSHMV